MGTYLRKIVLPIIAIILPIIVVLVTLSVFRGENQTALDTFLNISLWDSITDWTCDCRKAMLEFSLTLEYSGEQRQLIVDNLRLFSCSPA